MCNPPKKQSWSKLQIQPEALRVLRYLCALPAPYLTEQLKFENTVIETSVSEECVS